MNLRDLKEIINKIDEDLLDLEVRVIADHGQVAMVAKTASVDYISEDEHVHEDDVDEDSVKIFLIGD